MTAAFAMAMSSIELSENSGGGETDFSTEGTAEERQKRFAEVTGDEKNVRFVDEYRGKNVDSNGSATYRNFTDAEKFQKWLRTTPAGNTRSVVNGARTATKFLGLTVSEGITLYRSSVMGFRGTIYLPEGNSISGYFSPLERGHITFGHELAHRSGVEVGDNSVAHVQSNLRGYKRCLGAGLCQGF